MPINEHDFEFLDKANGIEIEVRCYDYEYSPEINVVGFERIEAYDMDDKPVELSEAEEERLHILANESYG